MRYHNLKTTLCQKLVLIALGFFLTLIILEAGLRLGGFIISSLQERRNNISLREKGAFRILCLGESTTGGQYPLFLEEILNKRNTGIKFSVIDKGIGGTNTYVILNELESNLDTYHPDMVITMMGVNDYGRHMPLSLREPKARIFWQSLRVFKLFSLILLHLKTRSQELGLSRDNNQYWLPSQYDVSSEKELEFKQAIALKPEEPEAYVELAVYCWQQLGRFSEAEALFKQAIALKPEEPEAYAELSRLYRRLGRFAEAEVVIKQAIALKPEEPEAYAKLLRCYRKQGKLSEAEALFKQAIALKPEEPTAYIALAEEYEKMGKLSEAEALFKQAIALNPKEPTAYLRLARCYRNMGKLAEAETVLKQAIAFAPKELSAYIELAWQYEKMGKLSEAEALFKQAIALHPKESKAYNELGWFYLGQGKLVEVEALFKQAIALNPKEPTAYLPLARYYRKMGKFAEAETVLKQAIAFNPKEGGFLYRALKSLYTESNNSMLAGECDKKLQELKRVKYLQITIDNYHKLKAILDKRGITYVCVQYPMRSLEPLKKIFPDSIENIVFVDNEAVFMDALKQGRYEDYFVDRFGGDFGHCTDRGNRLLAENIANIILKEVFHK